MRKHIERMHGLANGTLRTATRRFSGPFLKCRALLTNRPDLRSGLCKAKTRSLHTSVSTSFTISKHPVFKNCLHNLVLENMHCPSLTIRLAILLYASWWLLLLETNNMVNICQIELRYHMHRSLSSTEQRTLFVIWCKHLRIGNSRNINNTTTQFKVCQPFKFIFFTFCHIWICCWPLHSTIKEI